MPSKRRPVYLPPKDFGSRAIPAKPQKATEWFRLYPKGSHPVYFSKNENHRYSPLAGPCGVLYVGADPETCIMEIYGDRIYGFRRRNQKVELPDSDWRSRHLALLAVPALTICDLTDRKTLQECRVDAAALVHPRLAVPQAWAIAIMQHPANFAGIRFQSRFTNGPCLALFDRASGVKVKRKLGALPARPEGAQIIDRFEVALV
jgi:hypothetical protein